MTESQNSICGKRYLESSHGGGNDYSAPCVKTLNAKGTHKGNHITANGFSWAPSPNDAKF